MVGYDLERQTREAQGSLASQTSQINGLQVPETESESVSRTRYVMSASAFHMQICA